MGERVPAWAESDERYPEREAEWRAAIARAERAKGLCAEAMYALGQQGRPADLMPMAVRAVVSRADAAEARAERAEAGLSRAIDVTNERDGLRLDLAAAIARAERAEAQLVALRDAAKLARAHPSPDHVVALDAALYDPDTAQAAEAYRASVEAPLRAEIERITARHDRRLAVIDDVRVALASPDGEDIRVAARRVVAERDTLAAALAEVREKAARVPCSICRGRGVYEKACSMCGDSTYDHQCNDEERPCPDPACANLRHVLAALPADLAAERDRRVRAEALEEAAGTFDRVAADNQVLGRIDVPHRPTARRVADAWMFAAQRLRARAADERGGR